MSTLWCFIALEILQLVGYHHWWYVSFLTHLHCHLGWLRIVYRALSTVDGVCVGHHSLGKRTVDYWWSLEGPAPPVWLRLPHLPPLLSYNQAGYNRNTLSHNKDNVNNVVHEIGMYFSVLYVIGSVKTCIIHTSQFLTHTLSLRNDRSYKTLHYRATIVLSYLAISNLYNIPCGF